MMPTMLRLSLLQRSAFLAFILQLTITFAPHQLPSLLCDAATIDSIEGRHSYSLTTFDPDGKLGQVERANIAASLGSPIFAICTDDGGVILAAPQMLPSPFIIDDGTSRFATITPSIVVSHSGISADGRVLMAAAQRLAIEHAYTFDEPIPMELLLQQMSLLMQEYTMKPASRPFGSTLVVAEVPATSGPESGQRARIFCIDPSGAVTRQEDVSVIHNYNKQIKSEDIDKVKSIVAADDEDSMHESAEDRIRSLLGSVFMRNNQKLHQQLQEDASDVVEWKMADNMNIVMATLKPNQTLRIDRFPAIAVAE